LGMHVFLLLELSRKNFLYLGSIYLKWYRETFLKVNSLNVLRLSKGGNEHEDERQQ
jgi:hypothetical protein